MCGTIGSDLLGITTYFLELLLREDPPAVTISIGFGNLPGGEPPSDGGAMDAERVGNAADSVEVPFFGMGLTRLR